MHLDDRSRGKPPFRCGCANVRFVCYASVKSLPAVLTKLSNLEKLWHSAFMNTQRATLITLGVADLQRSKEFYQALGWEPHARSLDDIIFFQMNGFAMALYRLSDMAASQKRPDHPLGAGAISLAQNYQTKEEVDEAYRKAIAAGGTSLKEPEEVFWGGYSAYFTDPDGHPWNLAFNPNWPLNDDGSLTLRNPDETC